MDITDVWGLFALTLETPRLVLRAVRDEDIPPLCDAALTGIHDPAVMPFSVPWTDQPADALPAAFARFHWGLRASCTPESWTIPFAVLVDARPIGVQELSADRFNGLRTVTTGSWLTRSMQRQGIGREMRAAVLMLAFDHFGAEYATSAAMDWNAPSNGVSRALGYRDNGVQRVEPRPGDSGDMRQFRLVRDEFVRPDWELRVAGVTAATQFLGIDDG